MYPDVYSFECTQGTNYQKKSFFVVINYDGNLKLNMHTRMFIPPEIRWFLEFTAEHEMTCLHGPHACQATQVNIFYEDSD